MVLHKNEFVAKNTTPNTLQNKTIYQSNQNNRWAAFLNCLVTVAGIV
jgi:hypothetical protein